MTTVIILAVIIFSFFLLRKMKKNSFRRKKENLQSYLYLKGKIEELKKEKRFSTSLKKRLISSEILELEKKKTVFSNRLEAWEKSIPAFDSIRDFYQWKSLMRDDANFIRWYVCQR